MEFLEGANGFAWEQAHAKGLADELTAAFERVATHLETMRAMTQEFRDPAVWTLLSVLASGIVTLIAFGRTASPAPCKR